MTKLHAFNLVTFFLVLFGSSVPSQAQPLYQSFSSLEFLLGNSPTVFIGMPGSVTKQVDDGVTSVAIEYSVEETLKGIHKTKRTTTFNLGRTPETIEQRIRRFERFTKNKSKCLVLELFQEQSVPDGQDQVFDLSDPSKLNVPTKDLTFIDDVETLVTICRKYCKANPGALLTRGVDFVLPLEFAQKHFSTHDVLLMLPVDPSLEKLAESFLDSEEDSVRSSAQRALKYFGRKLDDESANSR